MRRYLNYKNIRGFLDSKRDLFEITGDIQIMNMTHEKPYQDVELESHETGVLSDKNLRSDGALYDDQDVRLEMYAILKVRHNEFTRLNAIISEVDFKLYPYGNKVIDLTADWQGYLAKHNEGYAEYKNNKQSRDVIKNMVHWVKRAQEVNWEIETIEKNIDEEKQRLKELKVEKYRYIDLANKCGASLDDNKSTEEKEM